MSEWKKYEGTDEQIEEMLNSEYGFILTADGKELMITRKFLDCVFDGTKHFERWLNLREISHYLLCEPHPLADMIKRWADTGQPVWIRKMIYCGIEKEWQNFATTTPDWDISGAEYSFTPFGEENIFGGYHDKELR